MSNRIWLKDNPWPDGHAIENIQFHGLLKKEGVFLHLEVNSENYYAKEGYDHALGAIEKQKEGSDYDNLGDWKSIIVWANYHSCHINCNKLVLLGNANEKFTLKTLFNRQLVLDNPPPKDEVWNGIDFDNLAFHCYILGHDAVGHHNIKIKQTEHNTPYHYDIDWKGKIALAYSGEEEFKHDFTVKLQNVLFKGFDLGSQNEYRQTDDNENGYWYDCRKDKTLEEREGDLRDLASKHIDINPENLKYAAEEGSDWLFLV